jgi:2-amino-4-hydroxy-6-hydroxymethyldihydropteridine diphosphokinase
LSVHKRPVIAAIALGSNVGDRSAHIRFALDAMSRLPGTRLAAKGPVLPTPAVGMLGVEPGGEYLNSAALIETSLAPRDLLTALHGIERSRGRRREVEGRWGPRTLDLDLLVYGDLVMEEPGFTVPHPRMHERRFVLEPLAAIAPDLMVPGRGRVADLLAAMGTGVAA